MFSTRGGRGMKPHWHVQRGGGGGGGGAAAADEKDGDDEDWPLALAPTASEPGDAAEADAPASSARRWRIAGVSKMRNF